MLYHLMHLIPQIFSQLSGVPLLGLNSIYDLLYLIQVACSLLVHPIKLFSDILTQINFQSDELSLQICHFCLH